MARDHHRPEPLPERCGLCLHFQGDWDGGCGGYCPTIPPILIDDWHDAPPARCPLREDER